MLQWVTQQRTNISFSKLLQTVNNACEYSFDHRVFNYYESKMRIVMSLCVGFQPQPLYTTSARISQLCSNTGHSFAVCRPHRLQLCAHTCTHQHALTDELTAIIFIRCTRSDGSQLHPQCIRIRLPHQQPVYIK